MQTDVDCLDYPNLPKVKLLFPFGEEDIEYLSYTFKNKKARQSFMFLCDKKNDIDIL